jgi:hypothetical protein
MRTRARSTLAADMSWALVWLLAGAVLVLWFQGGPL